MELELLPGQFAICHLSPKASEPPWLSSAFGFTSVTRTEQELSIVCREELVPQEEKATRGWRAVRVAGELDFGLTGILHSLTEPLAKARISLFAVSTYRTDYLLLQESDLARACSVWESAGHNVT